jgi:cysteine desulfurase
MVPIYLDHNATTPLLPAAWEAMRAVAFGNPASAHHAGRQARRFLDDAREQVATLLGAHPDEVIFTSGATEANNLALFGLAGGNPSPTPPPGGEGAGGLGSSGRILASPIEHPCVAEPLQQLAGRGLEVDWLSVNGRGIVECGSLAPRMTADSRSESAPFRLATIMLANHETGAIQPVRELAAAGVPVHCDAAQAVGKIPVSFHGLGVTALTASGHKFRGPKGIGLLLLKRNTPLRPLLYGGHQQRGHRPGTEPAALAVGLAVALDHAVTHMAEHAAHTTRLRLRLLDRLRESSSPVVLNGPAPGEADSLPTTLNVSFPGCRADVLLVSLDLAGVACATGSACSSGSLLPSPVLAAMRVPDDVLRSAMRFSVGPTTTEAEIDDAAGRIAGCVARMRTSS